MKHDRTTCVTVAILFGLVVLSLATANLAQQVGKVWRIAVLIGDRPGAVEAIVAGLRELNYVEGKNFVMEVRHYLDSGEQLRAAASEVVRFNPDVIVVGGAVPAKAVSEVTKTIPIVMAAGSDPVALGMIASLARPGGNVTGFTDIAEDVAAKRVELLKEAAPHASRIAVVGCLSGMRGEKNLGDEWTTVQSAAQSAGLAVVPAFIRAKDELSGVFASVMRQKVDAVLVLECGFLPRADLVTNLINGAHVPAIYPSQRYADSGGFMAYGPDTLDQYRRTAIFVDKILKGTKPGDIPVEQPSKVLFAINLKTAKSIGLTVPQKLVLRADKVIE